MTRICLPITLLLSLVSLVSLRAEAPPVAGTLPEDYLPALRPLLKEAVERSPTTISASIALARAEANRYLSASTLWPSVSASGSYMDTSESVGHGTPSRESGSAYSAGISQPIFQWGAYKNQAQIGSLGVKISERQFADAYRSLAVTIREQYMSLVVKKIALRNARFQQKLSEQALATQHARFEAGSVSEAEVQGFSMSVEDNTLAADRAEEDYRYAKRVFTRLVGIEDLPEDQVPLELPHPEYSANLADALLSGFVGEGIETTFQSEVFHMYLEQADKTYSIAKVRLLPKVSANASYSYSYQNSVSANSVTQVGIKEESVNVGANWTLFDGFATRGAKLSALENRRQYERLRQNYIDTTVDSVTYTRHQLGFAQRAMASAEVHNALIEVQVKRFIEDKALGYASQATIDAGTLNLDATQFNMAYARNTYLNTWTEFVSIAGVDPALANLPPRYVR